MPDDNPPLPSLSAQPNQTPKKTKKSKKKLLLIISGVLIATILLIFGVFAYQLSVPVSRSDKQVIYDVKEGQGVHEVATGLKKAGLINSALVFELYTRFGPARGKLIPGPYSLRSSMNIKNISRLISTGQIAVVRLTIPEGYTVNKIARLWEANDLGSADDFIAATKQTYQYDSLPDNNTQGNLEGFLFPATYEVKLTDTPSDLINQMLTAYGKKAAPLIKSRPASDLNDYQVLTLASIVEFEGLTEEDRKMIAGVFLNRLKAGMKLQSDVTVNYATGKSTTVPSDLKIDSPYNTYIVKGLPPAPIGSPGLESIGAVVSPTKNDYLFFLADKNGKVHYATTLTDHEKNIKAYLQ